MIRKGDKVQVMEIPQCNKFLTVEGIFKIYKDGKYLCTMAYFEETKDVMVRAEKIKKVKILDKIETKYLKSVIQPFRRKVKTICKCCTSDGEFIQIKMVTGEAISLPYFGEETMYRAMKLGRDYTPKELELL